MCRTHTAPQSQDGPPSVDAVPCAVYVDPSGRPSPAASPDMLNAAVMPPSSCGVRVTERDVTLVADMPPKADAAPQLNVPGKSCVGA